MTKISIQAAEGSNEVVIRKGDADEIKHPKSLNITGILGAVVQFLQGKDIDPKKCHLKIYGQEGKLELVIDDTDPHTTHNITGILSMNKMLEAFAINTEKRFTIAEFLKFAKTMKYYFTDKAAHATLIDSIQKWSVKIERDVLSHNDNKGNSNFQTETKVRAVAGFVDSFSLTIPIFQGYPSKTFKVEIGLDPRNAQVDLYLFSDELFELTIGARENAIAEQLSAIEGLPAEKSGFSKVYIS